MKSMNKKIYGTTVVGERGQVVIPIEARQELNLEKGDKLLVVGMGNSLIGLLKLEQLDEIVSKLSERLEKIQSIKETLKNQKED